jgi:hypothetical protein
METGLSVRNVDFTVKRRRHNGIRISGSNVSPSAEILGSEVAQDRIERDVPIVMFLLSTSFRCALHHHEQGHGGDTLSLVGESAPASSQLMSPAPPTSLRA